MNEKKVREAIEIMKNERPSCGEKIVYTEGEKCEAYDIAIDALEQTAAAGEMKAPMRHAPRVYSDKRKPPESARRHMKHRPYQRGGDAGENGNSGNDRDAGCERGGQGI